MAELDYACIIFAMRHESSPFRKLYKPLQVLREAPCSVTLCGQPSRPVLVVETGIGVNRTDLALNWIVAYQRPLLIIAAGYCGALSPNLRSGDLVLASEVMDGPSGPTYKTTFSRDLTKTTDESTIHLGSIVTMPRIVATTAEKQALHDQTGALVVDMETAAIAKTCVKEGIPFAALRAVVDDARMPLSPRLASLLSGGQVSTWRLIRNLACSPGLLGDLVQLARRSRVAAAKLAAGLSQLLE